MEVALQQKLCEKQDIVTSLLEMKKSDLELRSSIGNTAKEADQHVQLKRPQPLKLAPAKEGEKEVIAKEGGKEIVEEKSGDDDSQVGGSGNDNNDFPPVDGDEEEETKDDNSNDNFPLGKDNLDNHSASDDELKGLSVGDEGNSNSMGGDLLP